MTTSAQLLAILRRRPPIPFWSQLGISAYMHLCRKTFRERYDPRYGGTLPGPWLDLREHRKQR